MFLFLCTARKDLLHTKDLAAGRVYLPIAAIVRDISLGEHGLAATIHFREFGTAPDDPNIVPPCSLVRLDDQRPQVQQRNQLIGVRCNVGVRRRHA